MTNLTRQSVGSYSTYLAGNTSLTGNFTTNGGNLLIFFSGSGWHTGGGSIGATILINGVAAGTIRSYTNEGSSHKAFVPGTFLHAPVPVGTTTFAISLLPGTNHDLNDYFSVTVLEFI